MVDQPRDVFLSLLHFIKKLIDALFLLFDVRIRILNIQIKSFFQILHLHFPRHITLFTFPPSLHHRFKLSELDHFGF